MENITIMIKPVSSLCNMKCDYCFYNDIAHYREVKSYGSMSTDTIKKIVERIFQTKAKNITFGFQGGEPTLIGVSFYTYFLQCMKEYNTYQAEVHFMVQTNGYNIDDDLLLLFKENKFLVGVSLDGPEFIHNKHRHNGEGKPTFNQVLLTIHRLKEMEIPFNILTVVTKQAVESVEEMYSYFKKEGFRYLQFIPCIPTLDGKGQEYSLSQEEFGVFLCKLFDLWFEDLEKGVHVHIRYFENLLGILLGMKPEICTMQGCCALNMVVESDGSVYPCDYYVLDQYKLGNIHEMEHIDELDRDRIQYFIKPSLYVSSKCKKCQYYMLCRGGCRRYRVGEEGVNILCEGYHTFLDYSIERLEHIARNLSS